MSDHPYIPRFVTDPVGDKTLGDYIARKEGDGHVMQGIGKRYATANAETAEGKASNPKDLIGSSKLPLNLVPESAMVYLAMAFAEGASKYGANNWRIAGVRASIYYAAARRHEQKYWNGEWADPVTKVPHLASAMACHAIVLDAKLVGKLLDDRPPVADIPRLIAEAEEVVEHLLTINAGALERNNAQHWTINDKVQS